MTFWVSQGKVGTVYSTGEVGKCTSYWRQIFSVFNTPKIIKIGLFLKKLFENIKSGVIWRHSVVLR